MKGHKVTNPDGTCRGHLFEVGKTYAIDGDPILCERGFHFCEKPSDCFNYYSFSPDNLVFEIEAVGVVVKAANGDKSVTNEIRIVRRIEWDEVLRICNTGICNTGIWNTGDRNTGDCNTGDCNTGDRNTGDWNTGDWNTGNRNTGDCNTGNWNTGDWNAGDWNAGIFCPKSYVPTIPLFGKNSKWTRNDWVNSPAYDASKKFRLIKWIDTESMTEEEIAANLSHKDIGGYLRKYEYKEACAIWWSELSADEKQSFFDLPNFDPAIFEEITGIKI